MSITRADLTPRGMEPCEAGEWVSYADHAAEVKHLLGLLLRALPCVEAEQLLWDALDRHMPLPPAEQAKVKPIAADRDELLEAIRKALGEKGG